MTERDRYTNEEKEAEPKETGKEASIVEKNSTAWTNECTANE